MPIVTKDGFRPVPSQETAALADAANEIFVSLTADAEVEKLQVCLAVVRLIQIQFESFHDGRGFSLARRLRNMGYEGRLRASGHVISDQFRYALECGFDDVEISDAQARRQPETDWIADRVIGRATYRDRLRNGAAESI